MRATMCAGHMTNNSPSLAKQFPKSGPSCSTFKYEYWYPESEMHPQGYSVTGDQIRNHTNGCLQDFYSLFYLVFTAHTPTPWKVYWLHSSACTPKYGPAPLRCGISLVFSPPKTSLSSKDTPLCNCLVLILLETVLLSDNHLAPSAGIIHITLPICIWFGR